MARESFFVRRARNLMRRPVYRVAPTKLDAQQLEHRDQPAVGGVVFQDFNGNGSFDTTVTVPNLGGTNTGSTLNTPEYIGTTPVAKDVGVGKVTVTVFDKTGAKVDQVVTATDGTWTSNVTGGPFRVEFTNVPTGLTVGPAGPNSGTPTQLVNDGNAAVSLGLMRASDYFRTVPLLVTQVYSFGDSANGPGANEQSIISFPYTSGASQQSDPNNIQNQPELANNQQPADHAIAIPFSQVGTTWGLGYNRAQLRGYTSAFTKRHAGFGPNGPGAIYQFGLPTQDTPAAVTTAQLFFDLQGATARERQPNGTLGATYTVDTLGTVAGAAAHLNARSPNSPAYNPNFDYDRDGDNTGWNVVGKSSLGGLDVSDDGSTVYVMNLADRRLYIIPVNPATGAADAANVTSIPIPIPASRSGRAADIRPWAVEVHNGLVYIGLVDSAESTQADRTNLRGWVYAFNPTTNNFGASLVNDASGDGFDLSYARGATFGGSDNFLPWSPVYDRVSAQQGGPPSNSQAGYASQYPQPMLSGLAFDRDGNINLSIRDRNGDQTGRGALSNGPDAGPSLNGDIAGRVEGVASGELLKGFAGTGGTFRIEANGRNPLNTAQTGTGVGSGGGPVGPSDPNDPASAPQGGEFYNRDDFAVTGHGGTSVGGITSVPGFGAIANTHFDPVLNAQVRTGGIRWYTAADGKLEKSYLVYNTDQGSGGNANNPAGTAGKANGLGDLIAIEGEAPPIQIGNKVFRDADGDGIQDAGEQPIAGVTVQLLDASSKVIGTAVTDANGEYYFNSISDKSSGAKATPSNVFGITGLKAGGKYTVLIPNAVGGAQQKALAGLTPTQAGATNTGDGKTVDGNGDLRNSDFTLAGVNGSTTFTLSTTLGDSKHLLADAGFIQGVSLGNFVWADVNNNGKLDGAEKGIDGVTVNLYNASDLKTVFQSSKTAGGGAYLFSGLAAGDYVVEIIGPGGFVSSSGGGTDLFNGAFETGLAKTNPNNNEDHGKAISGSLTAGFTIRTNTVTLVATDDLVQDFGLVPVYSLGNRVWLDKNNSGTIDAADGPTPGVNAATVKLYRPTDFDAAGALIAGKTTVAVTSTDANGYYRFDNLLGSVDANDTAGKYVVVVDGTTGGLSGRISSTGAAKAFEPAPGTLGTVTTTDSDDNGTTIPGNLVRSGTVILGPADNAPSGETDLVTGADPQGTTDKQANMTLDFGFFDPQSIGNRLFEDKNNNGVFDGNDAGLDGVPVNLFAADAKGNPAGAALDTVTTTKGGFYLFSGLGDGSYVVSIGKSKLPAGFQWQSSTGTNGSTSGPFEPGKATTDKTDNDDNGTFNSGDSTFRTAAITLAAGTAPTGEQGGTPGFTDPASDNNSNLTLDIGVYRPLSLGNLVWVDLNNSGTVDAADGTSPGLVDIPVRLFFDANGNGAIDGGETTPLATTKTDSKGLYQFTNLADGKYVVEIDAPVGFASSSGGNTEPGITADTDNTDHGTQVAGTQIVRSGIVVLSPGTEPTGETGFPGSGDIAADADSNYTVDFGIFQSLAVGNRVFNDLNNNGKFDAGEDTGVGGVVVTLLDSAGAKFAETTTKSDGTYRFQGLPAGKYTVQITPPAGFTSSTGTPGSPTGPNEPVNAQLPGDENDQGTNKGGVILAPQFELLPGGNPDENGTANLRQDFGIFVPSPLSIGNLVFEDANNNGTLDAGEKAIPNATVSLFKGATLVGTQTTDTNGNYLFKGLSAGDYKVVVEAPVGFRNSDLQETNGTDNKDAGLIDPAAANKASSTVTLTDPLVTPNPDSTGTANLRQDFGFFRVQNVGNLVFLDANNNGVADAGEKGIADITVELISPTGNVVQNQKTDSNGKYLFTNVLPGEYTVRLTPPAKFTSSTGTVGSKTGKYEPGLAQTDTTDSSDRGTVQPNGTITTKFTLTATGNPDSNGFDNLRQDFGLFQPVTLGNLVWLDSNNNGKFDPVSGEKGIAAVPVDLLDAAGKVLASTKTDADGLYQFPVVGGAQYIVRITPTAGLVSSTGNGPGVGGKGPYEPSTGKTDDSEDKGTAAGTFIATELITVADPGNTGNPDDSGFANLRQDFGLFQPVPLSIGNLVFNDANNNGTLDAGETPIPGATVTLTDANGNAVGAPVVTGNDGIYRFDNLAPGKYTITVVGPAGSKNSDLAETGGADNRDVGMIDPTQPNKASATVTLTDPSVAPNPDESGKANLRQDFGFFTPIVLTLGDLVFEDLNNNGKLDAGETPIAGAEVTLLDANNTKVGTVTTKADGLYRFDNLAPGKYTVQVTSPTGFRNSDPTAKVPTDNSDNGTIDPTSPNKATAVITLAANESGVDFGFFRPQAIGNRVFIDANNDGVFQTSEAGVPNVTVELLDTAGVVVRNATTNAQGLYRFDTVAPGSYSVRITPPAGFVSSTGKNGSPTGPNEPGLAQTNTVDDNDRGTTNGKFIQSAKFTLAPGTTNPDGLDNFRQDFGLFQPLTLGNLVFADPNKNGKLDTGETGTPNVAVRLLDGSGNVVATTTTDATGKYAFGTLVPGSYQVEITPPAGQTPSGDPVDPLASPGSTNVGTAKGAVILSPVVALTLAGAPQVDGNTDPNNFSTFDFGLFQAALAKVSGKVFRDPNIDGKFSPGTGPNADSPIGGVTITLFNEAGQPIATTKTNRDGFYEFPNLPAGKYTLRETQPGGILYDGIDTPGTGNSLVGNDAIAITLNPGDNSQSNNFAEVPPSQLQGNVYVDLNRNGTLEPNETPIPGTVVTISGTAFAGTPLARPLTAADAGGVGSLTVTTGPDGRWEFPLLPPGTYTVTETQPANFMDAQEQNGDGGLSATVGNDVFSTVILSSGSINGPLNFGEVTDALPPPVPGVPPSVVDPTKRNFLGSTDNTNVPQPEVPNVPPTSPRPSVQTSPSFGVTTGNPDVPAYVVSASGAGRIPSVRVFDYATGVEKFRLSPYEAGFTGGVRTAVGDVNNDGVDDIVTTTGVGGGPRTRVFSGVDGTPIRDFFAFEPTFRGGTFVAVGDVNGDGFDDVIVGAEVGGGPRITTFSGRDGAVLNNFFAFDANQRGGTRVAAGDLNGDGRADIIASTGAGVPTRVRAFDGTNVATQLLDFAPFEEAFTGGINIAAGDFNGDGVTDIITGAEAGGGPRLQVFDGKTRAVLSNTFAFDNAFTGGVRVSTQDVNGDGRDDLIVTPGPGGTARVRVLSATDLAEVDSFFAFEQGFTGGAYVG